MGGPFRPSGVLCCGNVVLDILVRPVEGFAWNTTAWVDSIEQHLGGNGGSTSYTLGRLGVPVRLLTTTGQDSFAECVLARLASAAVDLAAVRRSTSPTACTVALVNSAGDRLLLHRAGVSREAFPEPVEFTPPLVEGISHVHVGNPFALLHLRSTAPETMRRARAAGLTTSLDAGWDATGRWLADFGPCLPHTDLLFVNGDEARILSGCAEPAQAGTRLRALGAGAVVIKSGAGGCLVFTAQEQLCAPAFHVPVVDTTGAGDCFAGAFLAALHRGRGWREAARFANAVAALAIQHLGATEGLRSFEETEAWMAQRP